MSAPAQPAPAAPSGARLGAALLVVAALFAGAHLASVWQPYAWLHGDGSFYYNVSRGLLEHGSLDQAGIHPHSWYERDMGWNRNLDAGWSNVAIGRDGKTWWPKHPWLLPLVATPFVYAAGEWGALLLDLILLLGVPLLAFRTARHVAPDGAAFAVAALLAAAPILTDHAWSFSNDLLYTVLVLAAFDRVFAGRAAAAGFLLGLAVLAKFTLILLAPALALVLAIRRDWTGLARAAAAGAGPVAVLLAANWYMFGGPLTTGYHRILVMEHGRQALHSHVSDFHWDALGPSLLRVGGILLRAWPIYLAAFAGLILLAWRRRWAEATALGVGLLAPVVFHAPYAWFRTAFVLPSVALSVPAAAALLAPKAAPEVRAGPARRLRWGRLALALALALFAVGGVRRGVAGPPTTFVERVRQAKVFLGEDPCDYFNNQNRRWECSGADRGDGAVMTGEQAWPRLRFGGTARDMVRLSPHPSGKVRAIEYPVRGGRTVHLVYGLADGGRGPVTFRVRAAGEVLLEARIEKPGLAETALTLPEGTRSLRFEVRGRAKAPFAFDGRVVP